MIEVLNNAVKIKNSDGQMESTGVLTQFNVNSNKEEVETTIDITENGVINVVPVEGKVFSSVTVNTNVASGGSEEFVGIKYSDFTTDGYWLPRVADARSIPISPLVNSNGNFAYSWFANQNMNGNGGYCVQLRDIYLPDGLATFSGNMFSNCVQLANIYGDFTNIMQVGAATFTNCKAMKNVPYMPRLIITGNNAFQNCIGLTAFKFYMKPEDALAVFNYNISINANTFNGCTNLLDIYVPWSEGEVANAPWGATNATIHYNTTYDSNHNPIV